MPTIAHKPMEPSFIPRQILLRRAAGYLELGELLVDADAGTPPSARRVLKRALAELEPLPADIREGAAASVIEGEAMRALGEWEAALKPLMRAARVDATRVEAWLGLGWCYKRLERLPDAIVALETGIRASPQQPILLYNLACYHSLAGHVTSAIDHLTRAITLDDRFRDLTGSERDFDPIRSDPRFVAATHVVV
jgi:tetratricopeptide (TPR) repeat protein